MHLAGSDSYSSVGKTSQTSSRWAFGAYKAFAAELKCSVRSADPTGVLGGPEADVVLEVSAVEASETSALGLSRFSLIGLPGAKPKRAPAPLVVAEGVGGAGALGFLGYRV